MRDLQPVAGVTADKKINPGKPPKMEWLPISALFIDDSYQREISARSELNVRKIAAGFSWSKFSPLIVMQQGKRYAIIDGQHRATAALSLGYNRVPCCIVDARLEDAAGIFAAINGDVTPMTILSLFKAARASGAPWATKVDEACKAAGITPLVYPVPVSKQKPLMTMALGTLRQVVERHGDEVLRCGLLCLAKAQGSEIPGHITSSAIRNSCSLFMTRPAWRKAVMQVAALFTQMNPQITGWAHVESMIIKKLGDGRSTPEAVSELRNRVQDLRDRKFSQQMVAATLRLPYSEVQRLWGDA